MSWDKDLPASDEKLRTLAGVITPNWAAIEEGDETSGTPIGQRAILLADRTVVATADDPVVVGATTYLYSKQDPGAGVQEAFIKDAASNEIQMTTGGKIGNTSTSYEAESISFDGTITYDEKMLPRAWGLILSGGNSFTINKNFVGVSSYVVDITGLAPGGGNFADGNAYTVIATIASSPINRKIVVSARTATSFTLKTTNSSDVGKTDVDVSVMLMMN